MKKLRRVLKNKSVRKRIAFTFLVLLLFRIGSAITVPGVDTTMINLIGSNVLSMMNLIGGGTLERMSVFALGVSPYITASIIVQLLSMDVIPALADMAKDGAKGRMRLDKITRYATIVLAAVQAISV